MYITYRNAARGGRATATGDQHKKFVKIGPVVPEMCSWTQTDIQTHTDGLITILRTPTGGQQLEKAAIIAMYYKCKYKE